MSKTDNHDYAGSPRSEAVKELRDIAARKDKAVSVEKTLRDDADGNSDNSGLADVLPKV
jgi:hypothetical protein